jgi:dTDP-4-dehydrorhamnose 3,5-epimerase
MTACCFTEIRPARIDRLPGVLVSPLRRIAHPQGDVLHGLKAGDPSFHGFGEAYFSTVHHGAIKGWKKHTLMTLNLVVPVGTIRFVVIDDRDTSVQAAEVTLGADFYARLTVPPGVWLAFQGRGTPLNLLLNVANLEHDPAEAVSVPLDRIPYPWS